MGNELVVSNQMDVMKLGDLLFRSGYFQDAKSAGQAVVKVLAGQELGIGPIASMTGINIIKGQVSPGAAVIAAVVKRSGKYNYTIRKLMPDECIIEYFENGASIGLSTFTAADAKKAGTTNMGKYPRNMLFARAMSNGAKWYCPDLFGGPIYEPGELGADVDYETGAIVEDPKWEEVTEEGGAGEPETDELEPAVEAKPDEPAEEAPPDDDEDPQDPGDEALDAAIMEASKFETDSGLILGNLSDAKLQTMLDKINAAGKSVGPNTLKIKGYVEALLANTSDTTADQQELAL